MPQLLIHSDTGEISYLSLEEHNTSIGRRSANVLCLPHLSVSGYHARIFSKGGCLIIEDLQSTNGTFVNGERIDRRVLVHLDDITIGSYRISYSETFDPAVSGNAVENVVQSVTQMATTPDSMFIDRRAVNMDHGANATAAVRVATGSRTGSVVMLEKPITTVGKTGGDLGAFAKKTTGYYFLPVDDRGAPMTHNGKGLAPQVEIKLMSGDRIEIGGEVLEFVQPYSG